MNKNEQEAVFTLCLMAAFADGTKDDLERAELRRMAEGFNAPEMNLAAIYHSVLVQRPALADIALALPESGLRQLAYEMAVCVCDADDARNDAERRFLDDLQRTLQLPGSVAATADHADALAAAPVNAPVPPALDVASVAGGSDTDGMILNYAILNGALELLPESLATLAIIPLQMKMVYRIGRQDGFELDRGHIKEFLATAGLGLTSQVVEGYARKLLGGFFGALGGGVARGLGRQAASSAMSFATTYALGHVARQYYAGGRRFSAIELKQLYQSLTGEAQTLYGKYAGAIEQKAGEVNVKELLPLLRQ